MKLLRGRSRKVALSLGAGLFVLVAGCSRKPQEKAAADPEATRNAERRALVRVRLALTNMELGQYEAAGEGFTEALHILPDGSKARSTVYWSRGEAYRLQGRLLEALADYNHALEINPDDPDSYVGRGEAYASFAPVPEENAYLLLLARQDFQHAERWAASAGGQNTQEMVQEARRLCKQVAETYEQAWKKLVREGRDVDERSFKAFEEAHALLWQGKGEAAEKRLDAAIEFQRDFAPAYCARGFCRLCGGRVEPARFDLAKCLELRRDYEPAKQLVAILEARGQDAETLAGKSREELVAQVRRHGFSDGELDEVAIRIRRLEQGWRGLSRKEQMKRLIGLNTYGDKIVPLIVERLRSERRQTVRKRYLTVLSVIGTPRAADALVRLQGVGDLAEMSTAELIAKARAMGFPAPPSQTDAIGRLIARRGERDVAQLLDAYKAEADRVAQNMLAARGYLVLVSVLKATGEPAVPGLIDMIRDPRYTAARAETAQVLGAIGDPRAVTCLQELLDGGADSQDVLRQVKWALHQLGARAKPAEGAAHRAIARLITQAAESSGRSHSGFLKRQDAEQALVQHGPAAVEPMVDYVLKQTGKDLYIEWNPGRVIARIARDHPDSPEPKKGVRCLLDAYCAGEAGRDRKNLAGIGWTLVRLCEELSRCEHATNPLRPLLAAEADRVRQSAMRLRLRWTGAGVPSDSIVTAADKCKGWGIKGADEGADNAVK